MPNARVGAMPLTQAINEQHNGDEKKKSKERRKPKGITMEDLKQQTAARLAKEQRRRNAATANRSARGKILSQEHRKPRIGNPGSIDHSQSCDNSIGSSSFHSSHPPPFSQNSVDDFPHATFDFIHKDPVTGHQIMQQQSEMQYSPNMQVYVKQQPHHYGQPSQNLTPHKSHGVFRGPGSQRSNHRPREPNQSKKTNHHVAAGSSNSSKLPHGLTVQELKEMTRARLAAEAAESTESTLPPTESTDNDLSAQVHNPPRQRVYSQESRSSQINNRPRIFSADSFGSIERQRLGSVESFGSAASAVFNNPGYQRNILAQPSLSNEQLEQPSVSSFSYDAMDNESLTSGLGSESFFGSETVGSRTTKYSANSLGYNLPYSGFNKGSPSSHGTKVTANTRNDGWNGPFARSTSPSSVPTVAQSCSSFGASDNDSSSLFPKLPIGGRLERLVSAGAVVPNSVAESVLGSSEEGGRKEATESFHDYGAQSNLVSPVSNQGKSIGSNEAVTPYTFLWSTSRESANDTGSGNLAISGLQSEWNSLLHIEGRNDSSPDNFPLTFQSKGNSIVGSNECTSPENHYYSSPFQPVPEERVIQNLMSRDVNVPENFLDDHSQDLTVPKLGSRIRRKKSRS